MARFSKVLRKTDIKKRLSVPTGFLSSLPSFNAGGHAVDFQAVDGSDRVWAFRCSIRRNGHPKPVISKVWLAFVASKSLKVGDKVHFLKKKTTLAPKHMLTRFGLRKKSRYLVLFSDMHP